MELTNNTAKLAQSASALGAAILGFGIGSKWGWATSKYSIWIIIIGGIIHIYGMYLMQMKDQNNRSSGLAKILWFSAWICLIALVLIIAYALMTK